MRKEMFILKRGEDFLALPVSTAKIESMSTVPKITKPVLHLDFADALGKGMKNDNFIHNLLALLFQCIENIIGQSLIKQQDFNVFLGD